MALATPLTVQGTILSTQFAPAPVAPQGAVPTNPTPATATVVVGVNPGPNGNQMASQLQFNVDPKNLGQYVPGTTVTITVS